MFDSNFSQFPELSTRRFVLREINDSDAPLIHELRSDQETNALIGRKNSNGLADALLHIDRIKGNVQRNESLYWVICFENSSDLIGTVGFWNYDIPAQAAEIGYELLTGFRRQGIMSEILPRVIQFGFEQMKLKRITAFCSDHNDGSIKLLKKYGFRLASSTDDITLEHVPGMSTFVLDQRAK